LAAVNAPRGPRWFSVGTVCLPSVISTMCDGGGPSGPATNREKLSIACSAA
jgi:hypothetical protein